MSDKAIQIGTSALNSLGIDSRLLSLSTGALFLCRCDDGTSFDLLVDQQISHVWKFICTDEATEVGTELQFQNSLTEDAFGFCVEERGVVNCYMERNIAGRDNAQEIITGQLIWFTKLLGELSF